MDTLLQPVLILFIIHAVLILCASYLMFKLFFRAKNEDNVTVVEEMDKVIDKLIKRITILEYEINSKSNKETEVTVNPQTINYTIGKLPQEKKKKFRYNKFIKKH